MALNWTDKIDGVDDVLAEHINEVAHAVIDNETAIANRPTMTEVQTAIDNAIASIPDGDEVSY